MNELWWLFIIGVIENFLISIHLKFFNRNKKIACFVLSIANILIWYAVLSAIVENLGNWSLIIAYSLGFGIADVLAIMFDGYLEKLAKDWGIKIYRKKVNKKKRKK